MISFSSTVNAELLTLYLPINYCLNNETDFEDYHPQYNKDQKELLLTINDIIQFLDRCKEKQDNIGISFGGEISGKWDALEIHGINGQLYTVEYMIGKDAGSYFKYQIKKSEVIDIIKNILKISTHLKQSDYEFKPW